MCALHCGLELLLNAAGFICRWYKEQPVHVKVVNAASLIPYFVVFPYFLVRIVRGEGHRICKEEERKYFMLRFFQITQGAGRACAFIFFF